VSGSPGIRPDPAGCERRARGAMIEAERR
jgi:hypothetical protein